MIPRLPDLTPHIPLPLQVKTPGSKRAKAVESAEDARIRQVFEQFDTNRGGTLDRKELRNALEALGMEGTRENVRTAMKRYDDDRSRTLDLGEFTQMVRDLLEQGAWRTTPLLTPRSSPDRCVIFLNNRWRSRTLPPTPPSPRRPASARRRRRARR